MIYITRYICPSTSTLVFRSRRMGTHRHPNASVAVNWPILPLKGKVLAPRGHSGKIFEIFYILGGAGDIHNSISMPNY